MKQIITLLLSIGSIAAMGQTKSIPVFEDKSGPLRITGITTLPHQVYLMNLTFNLKDYTNLTLHTPKSSIIKTSHDTTLFM